IAVAALHRPTMAPPEVLPAVAVEVQAGHPARHQWRTLYVVPGFSSRDMTERAAAIAAVGPQPAGRSAIAVRNDEDVRTVVTDEGHEQRVEAVAGGVQHVDPLRGYFDKHQRVGSAAVNAGTTNPRQEGNGQKVAGS